MGVAVEEDVRGGGAVEVFVDTEGVELSRADEVETAEVVLKSVVVVVADAPAPVATADAAVPVVVAAAATASAASLSIFSIRFAGAIPISKAAFLTRHQPRSPFSSTDTYSPFNIDT